MASWLFTTMGITRRMSCIRSGDTSRRSMEGTRPSSFWWAMAKYSSARWVISIRLGS